MISMKTMKIIFPLWLVMMILLSTTTSSAAGINHEFKNGKTTLYTDATAIEVVGQTNTPSFFFWDQGDNDTTYKLSFDSVFEYEDDNSDGGFTNEDDKKVPNIAGTLQHEIDHNQGILITDLGKREKGGSC